MKGKGINKTKVVEISKIKKEPRWMRDFRINSYLKLGNYEEARKYSKIALASAIKSKNKYFEYKVLKYYSKIYKNEKEDTLAIEYLAKCINIIKELNDNKTLADLYIEIGSQTEKYSFENHPSELQRVELDKFIW